jgi:hypothetical protein
MQAGSVPGPCRWCEAILLGQNKREKEMNKRINISKFFNPSVISFGVEIEWSPTYKTIEFLFFKYSIIIYFID